MQRKATILLTLIMVLIMAVPTLAADLDLNGKPYQPAQELYLEDGISRVTPADIVNILGCDVSVDGDSITIVENDNVIQMTMGSTTAIVNGEGQTMPRAPVVFAGQTYLPLRFVLESVGAIVGWEGQTSTVTIEYNETREGMTAEEIMAKSSTIMNQTGRYKMTADTQIDMDIIAKAAGEEDQTMKMNMASDLEAWLQNEPLLMYMKQKTVMNAPESPTPEPQTVTMEMVFNEDGMFMNMPETGWLKMDLEDLNMEELMKQSMSQDPTAVMEQIKEMGMSLTFANDQQKEGKDYWILNATMGGDLFKNDYFNNIMQQMPALENDEDMDMQKLLESMELDFVYTIWVDQATFYNDYMELAGKMKYSMDIPVTEQIPASTMVMIMAMQGNYIISDYGLEFTVPEIKDARDYEEYLTEQMAQLEQQVPVPEPVQ